MRPQIERWGVAALLGAIASSLAVGRLWGRSSLSPPDLAFFHQATWGAAHGLGFHQTALEFDAGTLLGSIHLSLVRAVWVPVYWLLPHVETLVVLQAAWLLVAGIAALSAIPAQYDRRVLVLGLHPLWVVFATCDLRPLLFLVPAAVFAIAGLHRQRPVWVALGAIGTILAREEAVFVLAALTPFAWVRARTHRQWSAGLALAVAIGAAYALPRLVWGHGSNITANTDIWATAQAIASGQRPLFRWPVEVSFALRCAIVAWPAFRCPSLWVPGLLGWLYIAVFSELEPAAPDHGGLHYLAVVAPFVLGAAAVGLADWPSSPTARRNVTLGLALGLLAAIPDWTQQVRFGTGWLPSPLQTHLAALEDTHGAVLAIPSVAPLVSGRPTLYIVGHFTPTPTRVEDVANSVTAAFLDAEPPPDGPPREEWHTWQNALPEGGLHVVAVEEGVQVWKR